MLIEWFAFGEDARHQDNYEGVDYIYGGWDQDAMQADQADHGPVTGDRLIDWVGAYNVYYLCPALYGEFVITRDHSPAIIEFLQQLAEGDGASEPANSGSSGFNEVAIVFPKEAKDNSHPVHPDNPAHFTCEQSVPPDLSILKTDDQIVVTPGQVLTYTLTVSNFGTLDATGVVISDTLPADTTFLAASHSGSYSEGVVTWPTVTLTVGASLSRTLTVQLAQPLPPGIEVITNTASVADDGSHGSDLWPEDNTASDVDRVTPLPDLTIAMVEGQSVVTPGQILTYTITISNAGKVDVTGVMISNTQGVHSSFVAASHGGSYTASVVTWPAIALTVGSSVSRTFTVQVDERLPAGVDAITQTAAVTDDGANGLDLNLTNNKVLVSVPVEAAPDLSLAKQANSLFAVSGQLLTYTLTYSNSGSQGTTGLVISETVPAGTTFNAAASSSGWNCNPAGSDCVLVVSDLAAGDGGVATFAVTVTALPPAEMAIITNTAVLTDDGQNGPDPTPANNQATDVTPVDFVPAAADDRVTVDEDSADNLLDVLANDVDLGSEPLTITLVGTASHGTVVNDLTALRYTPLPDFSGSDQFAYTVSDGILSDTARVTVTVAPLNDPPLAVVDTVTLPEDSPMTPLAVLANDTDVDGDSLTITLVSAATHGTVIHTGAELLYAPTADFYGTDCFTYTVSDGLLTDTAGVTVVIAPVNDPPIAVGDDVTVDEDSLNNVLDVLANDTDVDSELLTITRVSTTTHGTLVNHGVEVSYTPEADFFGTDHVTYTVSDGVLTGTALVTLSVLPINDPPVAVDDDVRVIMNSAINRLNVTDNDVDPDGDLLTITLVSTASHGTVIRNATSLLYAPTANFTGTDYLTYTVSDGTLSDTGMITVTISKLDNTIYLPVIIKND